MLKLYIWDEFSPDYKNGLAFAIAESIQEAQRLVKERLGHQPLQWGDVQEHPLSDPIAFACTGGG